jgi:hypothetical protein
VLVGPPDCTLTPPARASQTAGGAARKRRRRRGTTPGSEGGGGAGTSAAPEGFAPAAKKARREERREARANEKDRQVRGGGGGHTVFGAGADAKWACIQGGSAASHVVAISPASQPTRPCRPPPDRGLQRGARSQAPRARGRRARGELGGGRGGVVQGRRPRGAGALRRPPRRGAQGAAGKVAYWRGAEATCASGARCRMLRLPGWMVGRIRPLCHPPHPRLAPSPSQVPATIAPTMKPHQWRGVRFLWRNIVEEHAAARRRLVCGQRGRGA